MVYYLHLERLKDCDIDKRILCYCVFSYYHDMITNKIIYLCTPSGMWLHKYNYIHELYKSFHIHTRIYILFIIFLFTCIVVVIIVTIHIMHLLSNLQYINIYMYAKYTINLLTDCPIKTIISFARSILKLNSKTYHQFEMFNHETTYFLYRVTRSIIGLLIIINSLINSSQCVIVTVDSNVMLLCVWLWIWLHDYQFICTVMYYNPSPPITIYYYNLSMTIRYPIRIRLRWDTYLNDDQNLNVMNKIDYAQFNCNYTVSGPIIVLKHTTIDLAYTFCMIINYRSRTVHFLLQCYNYLDVRFLYNMHYVRMGVLIFLIHIIIGRTLPNIIIYNSIYYRNLYVDLYHWCWYLQVLTIIYTLSSHYWNGGHTNWVGRVYQIFLTFS